MFFKPSYFYTLAYAWKYPNSCRPVLRSRAIYRRLRLQIIFFWLRHQVKNIGSGLYSWKLGSDRLRLQKTDFDIKKIEKTKSW